MKNLEITEELRKEIMDWWDAKPIDERLLLKSQLYHECKYLVNIKAENIIKSGIYKLANK